MPIINRWNENEIKYLIKNWDNNRAGVYEKLSNRHTINSINVKMNYIRTIDKIKNRITPSEVEIVREYWYLDRRKVYSELLKKYSEYEINIIKSKIVGKCRKVSKEDEEFIRENWKKECGRTYVIDRLISKYSENEIVRSAKKLNVVADGRWSEEDELFLIEYWDNDKERVYNKFKGKRSKHAIRTRVCKLRKDGKITKIVK